MKIIILGSGSFAGQATFANLLNRGFNVYGINRSKPKNKYYWEWRGSLDKEIGDYWFDLNINNEVEKIVEIIKDLNPTHIVDFMGQGMVAPSWNDPSLWYRTNIVKKTYLLEEIRKFKNFEKYVRASTPEVFGSNSKYVDEYQSFNPSTPYAVSHSAIDFHIRCIGENFNFPYTIGRFSNFYGEGQQLYRLIPKAFLSFLSGNKFILDGDGSSIRSFIYSDDFVSAINKLLFDAVPKSEYNFSGSEEISIIDLVKIICKETQVQFDKEVQFGPDRKGKDLIYRLDCIKSKKELDWEPKISLLKGINNVQKWIRRNLDFLSKESWDYIHKC